MPYFQSLNFCLRRRRFFAVGALPERQLGGGGQRPPLQDLAAGHWWVEGSSALLGLLLMLVTAGLNAASTDRAIGAVRGLSPRPAGAGPPLPGASKPGPSLEQYIHGFELSYRYVQTLRAAFTQTYVSGGRTRVESGTVYLARGGRMRWDYREPEMKVFISDGKQLMLYIPTENQLTRSAAKTSEDVRAPLAVLLSRLNLRKLFSRIEFADQALSAEAHDRVLRAYPKRGYEEDYREVLIELTPALDIRRLVVSYPDNSTMQFAFDRIERNVALKPSLFQFNPPAGTEIIQH